MNYTKRIAFFAAAIVLSVLLLAGGQWIWQRTQVNMPIAESIQKTKSIRDWKLKEEEGKIVISVALKDNANLEATYQELDGRLSRVLGTRPYSIDLLNSADTKLESFFETTRPVLYEAISTGHYTWLVTEINNKAAENNLTARVAMDEKFVYLELHSGKKTLYKLIPRNVDTSDRQG